MGIRSVTQFVHDCCSMRCIPCAFSLLFLYIPVCSKCLQPTDGVAVGICMAVAGECYIFPPAVVTLKTDGVHVAKLECIVLMRTLNARAKLRVQAVSGKGLGRQSLPNSPLDLTVIPGYETFEPTPSPVSSLFL